MVNAVKTGHREKAAEFFKRFANRLHATISMHDGDESDSWARWFVLPYIEHPETDPYFQVQDCSIVANLLDPCSNESIGGHVLRYSSARSGSKRS